MDKDRKIGYFFNEQSVTVNELELLEKGDRVTGKGILQTGNERNRNGRFYRTEDLAKEIVAPRQMELLNTGNMLGEAGHPLSKELIRQQTIDPTNTCVRYIKLWMEGDNVMGLFQGTNNALGETFDKDLRMGVKPAFSLRALGTIRTGREGAVVENLKIITYDYVIYPSHPGAYTTGIVNESSIIPTIESGFDLNKRPNMDATKSFIGSFTNEDVVNIMRSQHENADMFNIVKDKSLNFNLLKECFDMTKIDTVDIISPNKVAITEAGMGTFVLSLEDYVAREIQNYR